MGNEVEQFVKYLLTISILFILSIDFIGPFTVWTIFMFNFFCNILCILVSNPLSVVLAFFSYSVDCLFMLKIISFAFEMHFN